VFDKKFSTDSIQLISIEALTKLESSNLVRKVLRPFMVCKEVKV